MSRCLCPIFSLLTGFLSIAPAASPAQSSPLSLWSLFGSPPLSGSVRFVVTDLGTLGGGSSAANSVNDLAQVAGSSLTASGIEHAFLFSDGKMTDLGTPGDASSAALGVNNQGHVVGQFL